MDNEIKIAPEAPTDRLLLARIFISPDEPRLRAGWRVLVQLFLLIVIVFFIGFLAQMLIGYGLNAYLGLITVVLAITTSVFMARRFLDRRSFVSLGLRLSLWTVWDVFVGFAIGGLIMGLIFYLEWAKGWLNVDGFAWQYYPLEEARSATLAMLVTFIFVGWQEELVSRGYQLQNLIEGLNVFWGVLVSSAIFSLLHLTNPGTTLLPALGILLAGVFLSFAYLVTRQLWLPIGLHIGWNFFEGTVFGYPVSGVNDFHIIRQSVNGPTLITGGVFGPEGGLILLAGLGLGFGLVYAYSRLRPRLIEAPGEYEAKPGESSTVGTAEDESSLASNIQSDAAEETGEASAISNEGLDNKGAAQD
jgi:membrane protease YdiL (CAAX protease family)